MLAALIQPERIEDGRVVTEFAVGVDQVENPGTELRIDIAILARAEDRGQVGAGGTHLKA